MIWANSSAWMLVSSMVEPLLADDGEIWNNPPNEPFPIVWFVPPEAGVLYWVSRLMYPLLVPRMSPKKLPMVGEVLPATCAS